MRIGSSFSQQIFLQNLDRIGADLRRALSELSTGQRVQAASDDPAAAAELLRLADDAQRFSMRRQGISQARPFLQLTENALTDLNEVLTEARNLAVQGASDTNEAEPRDAIGRQVTALLERMDSIAALRVSGRYIFSGTMTDTAPYDAARTYQGNGSLIEIPIDHGTVALNIAGDQIFGASGAGGPIDILERLETALFNNDGDAVSALLPELDQALSDNGALLGRIGGQRRELEDADVRLQDLQLEIARRSDELGAADMAQVISDVQRLETGYQATLQAGARLFGPTFFDFLG